MALLLVLRRIRPGTAVAPSGQELTTDDGSNTLTADDGDPIIEG